MDNSDENLRNNLWQHQQHGSGDNNQQFYANQYQPMPAGFDLQRELNSQPTPTAANPTIPPENMVYVDNKGPYLKIYFNENNMNNVTNEYELFDRNPHELPTYTRDGLNNFLPNTQSQLSFQQHQMPSKNPTIQSSVIHHLVSSLGPNKTGSYSPFGETIINNSMPTPPCNVEPVLPDIASCSPPPNPPPPVNVKKTRIVAEVKPMRMSYSDVVSKNVLNEQVSATSPTTGSTNSASSSPNTTLPVTTKPMKVDKSKYPYDKKSSDGDKENQVKAKKSPINTSVINNGQGNATDSRKPQANVGKAPTSAPSSVKKRTSQGTAKNSSGTGVKSSAGSTGSSRNTKNKYASDSDGDDDDNSSMLESDDDIDMEFYNVHKNVCHGEHHNIEKIVTTKGMSSYKKVKNTSAGSTKKAEKEKVQRRTGKTSTRKRQKHEVLLKLCIAWGEYLLKFVQWLWTLIYDVGYLSCGIIWDRLSWCYQCAAQGFESIRCELNGNPGKAAWLWIKNTWKRFDGKFDKKSKWAFWRWMFKKKQPASETVKDYYKDGKLPKTAEEAMKSLLNCKGKDAYSILGVNPNCSQEQIRKHYKKIAVLVHPDKNKQPGAEEAFKVLQRSFELIGEPESRQQYDQSMAEALHAEKAFTELNDLLVQLQTKISEAANTIRCSSCCFRHPRKPTGRKPFAARECSSCKIRHPAREGDIWAETSCFGFRWKYLALMEGNVYDITQWALCQRGALSHLQANSCVVQYKIVLGGNQHNQSHDKEKFKKDSPASEPNMDDFFLNNIYAGQNPQSQPTRRRFKKN